MHTILGAGGPVANALTKELISRGQTVRLASRKPVAKFPEPSWIKTDLLNNGDVLKATEGSSVIYMCAGLVYNKKIWAEQWPVIMDNLIAAAKQSGARLLFFDNVYMYGKVDGPMKEDTPYRPVSVKGKIRAGIAEKFMSEVKNGRINGSIARAADFYGSESMNSFFDSTVLAKYAKKGKALWLGNPSVNHSFTYVPDAGKALFLLGQNDTSDGQIWHVPTAPSLTGKEFMQLAANVFGVKPSYQKVSRFMLQAIGLFDKLLGETAEMYYQYDRDYIFDSSKFEKAFGIMPVSYAEGMKEFGATLGAA